MKNVTKQTGRLAVLGAVAGLLLGAPAAHGQAPVVEWAQLLAAAHVAVA